jgi:integrase/recombinase XerC
MVQRTERITTAGLIDRFCQFLRDSDRSPLTVRSYRSDMVLFTAWFAEENGHAFTAAKLTSTDLRQYKRHRAAERSSPNTINRKLATLSAFLQWAVGAHLLPADHGIRLPRPVRETKHAPRWLTRLEQHRLLRAVERGRVVRDVAVMKILLNTGLRVSEVCALEWRDVRISERKGELIVRNGKGEKQRRIPLNRDAREALCLIGYGEHAGQLLHVFCGQRGALTPRGLEILFARYAKQANLKGATPHSLRHSFCKNLVDAGVTLEKVAALAGHDSLDTTRRYCDPCLHDLENAVALIGDEEPEK